MSVDAVLTCMGAPNDCRPRFGNVLDGGQVGKCGAPCDSVRVSLRPLWYSRADWLRPVFVFVLVLVLVLAADVLPG